MPGATTKTIILRRQKPQCTADTPHQPCVSGLTRVKSVASDPTEVRDFITCQTSRSTSESKMNKKTQVKEEPSSMQESVPLSKNLTSKGKSNILKKGTLRVKSYLMSDLGSTTLKEVSRNYWIKSHREMSEKLLLPTVIDSVGTDWNFSNGFSESTLLNSWCSVKKLKPEIPRSSLRTSLTSVTTLSPSITERKQLVTEKKDRVARLPRTQKKKEDLLRVKTFLIHMKKSLIKKIKLAMEATAYVYNRCVQLLRESGPQMIQRKTLREKFVKNDCIDVPKKIQRRFQEVPYDVKDGAVDDFLVAYNNQLDRLAKGDIKFFVMHFMKKKYRTITIQSKFIKTNAYKKYSEIGDNEIILYPSVWSGNGRYTMWSREDFPPIECAVRLTVKNNRYYLAIPVYQDITLNQTNKIVALDPGVRIFQTTYDTQGVSYMIGQQDIQKIESLTKRAQRMREGYRRIWENFDPSLKGKRSNLFEKKVVKSKITKGLLRAASRLQERVSNMITDLHRKLAKFLCYNYDTVIIPKFEVQNMISKNGNRVRLLNKTAARRMLNWSHYKFRSLLISKGEQVGTNVIEATEHWTSKVCTRCLFVNKDLGSNEVYNCPNCELSIARDVNGARNILIKNWHLV